MPISSIDGCNEQHWLDVKDILTESVESAGFNANLVTYANNVSGLLLKTKCPRELAFHCWMLWLKI
jgi:hypothetical protein